MAKRSMFVGMDVHKESIDISVADEGRHGDVRRYGVIAGDLDALAKVLEADVPGAQQATRVDSTVVVEVQAQTGVLPVVFGVAERHGFEVSDLSVTEPTLETVFINLTGKDLRE